MANPPIGNNFIEGPLGVVQMAFDGVDLGKTLDSTSIEPIEDIFDVMHAQNGTQPFDKIPTGQAYRVTCQLSEMTEARMAQLMRGFTKSGSGNSVSYGRDIYRSGRSSFAKTLTIARVDSDGNESLDPRFILNFYLAFPMVTGAWEYSPDGQKILPVEFYIFYDETHGAFGYHGYASSVSLTPA